jgi:hypothetical protein
LEIPTPPDEEIVSNSPGLRDALDRLQRVAPIDTTALLGGETGSRVEPPPMFTWSTRPLVWSSVLDAGA